LLHLALFLAEVLLPSFLLQPLLVVTSALTK
jgi:hypothetical protein